MQPKAFERGMYYPMLADVADKVRYRLVPIEIKCCGFCPEEYERGSVCRNGHTFDGDTMRRKMKSRLMWCGVDASDAASAGHHVPIYLPEGRAHCNFPSPRCDNYFTISQRALESHKYCPRGHELPRPADGLTQFHRALHYEWFSRGPCPYPECDEIVVSTPWCPCCRASRWPAAAALPPRLTILWVSNIAIGVALDDPDKDPDKTLAARIPEDFSLDAKP